MYHRLNNRQDSCTSSSQCSPSVTSSSPSSASTTLAVPTSTMTIVVESPSPIQKGPIIAGVICGILVLAIFVAMLWFFCRRRRQLNELGRSSPLIGLGSNGSEKFAMDHSIDEAQSRQSGGGFAPFGGYRKTPSMDSRESYQGSTIRTLNIGVVEPIDTDADEPIPDPEKSTLIPPPAHEHPAHHPLPGKSPNIPVYTGSQHSAHPASPSVSATRGPTCDSPASQRPKQLQSFVQLSRIYASTLSHFTAKPASDTQSPNSREFRAESQSRAVHTPKLGISDESPKLPDLKFPNISLDVSSNNTLGINYQLPSPSDMAPIPLTSSRFETAPILMNLSTTNMAPAPPRRLSPVQRRPSTETLRPTPIAEVEVAEIGSSPSPSRVAPSSEMHLSPSLAPTGQQDKNTKYSFQTPPLATSGSDLPGFTPFRTPSLSRAARILTQQDTSEIGKGSEVPPFSARLAHDSSPTLPPLKFKKGSPERPKLTAIPKKPYTPPRKPTPSKDLPFNYISLPSPQSPVSPSAIQSASSQMDAIARTGSALTTYSIPIGLVRSQKRKKTDESIINTDSDVLLTHNHSREWSESEREHVMSWATYTGPDSASTEGEECFSPMNPMVAQAQRIERLTNMEPVHVSGGKLLRRGSPEEEMSELEAQEVERSTAFHELKRRSPQQDLREGRASPMKLALQSVQPDLNETSFTPTKRGLKRSSRVSVREKKASIRSMTSSIRESKSPESEKIGRSPRSDIRDLVSPLFTPIQRGQKFSPLSPPDRDFSEPAFSSS